MSQILGDTVRAQILARLAQLESGATPLWGGFTATAMLFHVNAGMRMALGELAAEPVGDPGFWHTAGKRVALADEPWPEGAPTSKEALPSGPVDFVAQCEAFGPLLERVAAGDPSAVWPPHPRLGPLTGEEWMRLTYNHIEHHFRQFEI
jgi:Protein of unknown function (DUF1569)